MYEGELDIDYLIDLIADLEDEYYKGIDKAFNY